MRHATGAFGRLARRVGRRGAFLLFLGFVDGVYGWSLAAPTVEARHTATLAYIAQVGPLWAWSALWCVVGAACFVGAFLRSDRIAYAAATFLKVLFGVTLLGAQVFGHVDRAYVGAAVWLVFAAVVYLVSTWPEPSASPVPPARSATKPSASAQGQS